MTTRLFDRFLFSTFVLSMILGSGGVFAAEFIRINRLPIPKVPSPTVPVQLGQEPSPNDEYKSWTFLLITDPSWAAGENMAQVAKLHSLFVSFGEAIGPKNAAVWFSKNAEANPPDFDIARNVEFCNRLGLKPSGGPYLIVTTRYPGIAMLGEPQSFPTQKKDMLIVELQGMKSDEISKLLAKLLDAIASQSLSSFQVATDGFWKRLFLISSTAVLDLAKTLSISVESGPFTAEIKIPSESGSK